MMTAPLESVADDEVAECWAQAGIPARYQRLRLTDWPGRMTYPLAFERAMQWLEESVDAGQSLMLVGPSGVGKTGLAVSLAWAWLELRVEADEAYCLHYYSPLLIPAGEGALYRPRGGEQEAASAVRQAALCRGLVIIDDLQAAPLDALLPSIIASRHAATLPTICGTQLGLAALAGRWNGGDHFGCGDSLVRRLREMAGRFVVEMG